MVAFFIFYALFSGVACLSGCYEVAKKDPYLRGFEKIALLVIGLIFGSILFPIMIGEYLVKD